MPLGLIVIVFSVFLPRFYVSLGLSFAAVGAALLIVRLLDVALDLIVGLAMDQTRTPLGRYRPWLLAGAPILLLGVYHLLLPRGPVSQLYLIGWLLAAYLGFSILTLSMAAWGANVAAAYHERARVYGVVQAMSTLSATTLLLLGVLTGGRIEPGKPASMWVIGAIIVIAIPIGVALTSLFTPERKPTGLTQARFSLADYGLALKRPAMLRVIAADLILTLGAGSTAPIYVYFFHDAKGFSIAATGSLLVFYIAAGLVGAPFWSAVAHRTSKHRALQAARVAAALTQGALVTVPAGLYLATALAMFSVGFCVAGFVPLIRAMVADIADEVRLETGKDLSSVIYAMVTTTQKVGTALTVAIIFPVLGLIGYQGGEGAHNSPAAVFGLEMCYLFAPVIMLALGAATMIGYTLDAARHGEIRAALEAKDAAQ